MRNKVILIVFINVFCIIVAGSSLGMHKTLSSIHSMTRNWQEVDVTIDDVSFESDGRKTDDGRTIYKYVMNRILRYIYKNQEYEVKDTRDYESEDPEYTVALRTGYKDEYTYKVNPESPGSVSKSYSLLGDGGAFTYNFDKIAAYVFIGIAVIADLIFLIKCLPRRKKIFD